MPHMDGEALRKRREQRAWTQAEAAARLGVSQTYVALLEKGRRPLTPKLARRAVRVLKLSPALLPVSAPVLLQVSVDQLAMDLGRLGYPGFAYMKGGWTKNPAEVLLTALAQPKLDSRVAEALPWLLLHYPDLDHAWLVSQARLLNLTNRLGFFVDLAKRVATKNGAESAQYRALAQLSNQLRPSRLAEEDTLGQESLTPAEVEWLRANRSEDAQFWNVLTDWRPEHLQYAAE